MPNYSPPRHFLDIDRHDAATLRHILSLARAFKLGAVSPASAMPMAGKTMAMIFEKPSTRTRVSFEVGVRQLGGSTVVLSPSDTQLGRGETIADTARVLSRYVDAIMIRTDSEVKLEELARHASVPVINGLTDRSHPCQVMADVLTFEERRGPIAGRAVAWVGDGNNMMTSWIHAAMRLDFELRLAIPEICRPASAEIEAARAAGARLVLTEDVAAAVRGADCVATDTWVSMGREGDGRRRKALMAFRVDDAVMALADRRAIFLHCLPAHRGEEVTDSVIDGPQSAVWDEAENRLHVQKGILAWCLE